MNQQKGLFWVIVGLLAVDILRYIGIDGSLQGFYATYFSAIIIYFSFFWLVNSQFQAFKFSRENILKVWLFILTFAIGSGIILASDYWDYKQLFLNVLGFSITPLFYYLGLRVSNILFTLNFYLKWVFTFGILLIPIGDLTNYELYARIMIPVTFLILFFPFVKTQIKILLFVVTFLSTITAPDFRSFQIKIGFASLLLLGYYFRRFFTKKIMLFTHMAIFLLPFFFILGAIFFDYNFFRDGVNPNKRQYIVNVGNNESDLLSDTRTFLYVEILEDLNGREWLIGKSAIGSYNSTFYGVGGGDLNGKRYSSEVGILNILLRNGLIGIIVYLTLLFRITRRAIIRSKNYLISSLALLLAFRWPLTFIEEFTQYDINFFFFWILLGFISNNSYQSYSNTELASNFDLAINSSYKI
jgi:hypothetical protein